MEDGLRPRYFTNISMSYNCVEILAAFLLLVSLPLFQTFNLPFYRQCGLVEDEMGVGSYVGACPLQSRS